MKVSNNFLDWLSRLGLIGFLGYFGVTFFVKTSQFFEILIPVILVFMMGVAYFLTQSKMNAWRAKRENLIKGVWEAYIPCPSPSSSMLNTMLKKGIKADEIAALRFQTWELKNNYFERQLKDNLNELKILDSIELEFLGFGDQKDAKNIQAIFPNAHVKFSKERLSEHVNLISLKNGDLYVWYEPVHKANGTSDQVYRPEDGAFLIKSEDPNAMLDYYHQPQFVK